MLRTDVGILTGASHIRGAQVSQDYAGMKTKEGIARIAISDGCSSAGATDIGARLIVTHLLSTEHPDWNSWVNDVKPHQEEDLLATAMWAELDEKGGLCGEIIGDGYVAVCWDDGVCEYIEISWSDNTPLYPLYLTDKKTRNIFCDKHSANTQRALKVRVHKQLQKECYFEEKYIALDQALRPLPITELIMPREATVEMVALASDGVSSVKGEYGLTLFYRLTSGIRVSGNFVRRRLGFWYARKKLVPDDDLSLAMIIRDKSKESGNEELVGKRTPNETNGFSWKILHRY